MAIDPVLTSDVLTSEDRWRRRGWHGRDNDAEVSWQVRQMIWYGVVVMTVVVVIFVLS